MAGPLREEFDSDNNDWMRLDGQVFAGEMSEIQ
jgi:hypothetical protein